MALRFEGLNEDAGDAEEGVGQASWEEGDELQENRVRLHYEQALVLSAEGTPEGRSAAVQVLLGILDEPVLTRKERPVTDPISQVHYLTLKSLGLLTQQGGDAPAALAFLCQAVAVDSGDTAVWMRIGDLALERGNAVVARHAFERAWTQAPDMWLCIERLATVAFELGDHALCDTVLRHGEALNPRNPVVLLLRSKLLREKPSKR